jgi:hypothetical protein
MADQGRNPSQPALTEELVLPAKCLVGNLELTINAGCSNRKGDLIG